MSVPMVLPPGDGSELTRWKRLFGMIGLTCAVVLLRLPFRVTLAVARWLGRSTRRPAETNEARLWVAAVREAARYWPGRAACLELSLAVFLVAALRRHGLDWCIGARFAPAESHAWVETVNGEPVGEAFALDHRWYTVLRVRTCPYEQPKEEQRP